MEKILKIILNFLLLEFSFMLIFYLPPIVLTITEDKNINCNYTKVWGPGLNPQVIIMPTRYFFIESFDIYNKSLNKSPGNSVFNVKIYDSEQFENRKNCRIQSETLDRQDGSFIVRYKLHEICSNLTIAIKCYNKDLKNFPLYFHNVYSDECFCVLRKNFSEWISLHNCPTKYKQIDLDLRHFSIINFKSVLSLAQETLFNDPYAKSLCHYVIKSNKLYRKCYGQYTGFKMFWDSILLFFLRKVILPDLEIIVNLGDWPLVKNTKQYGNNIFLPIFSWCGSDDTLDIVVPTYDLTESSLENMGRVTLDTLSVQGNTGKTWKEKIPKLFWRGRDSSRERLKLIKISRYHDDLINASLTDFFFFKNEEQIYGPKEKRIPFYKFFDYKYQLNIDGTVASYRFPYLLISDTLVFKQNSKYYEYFYKELKEWKHFIPVKEDLSDLIENIQWAIAHDNEAHNIARNGQYYARNNLLPLNIFCYYAVLLYEYSKKITIKDIIPRSGMEEVYQKSKCNCNLFYDHHEDL